MASPATRSDAKRENEIHVREAIVEIEVSDLPASKQWYARLFGKKGPDLEPFPGNVEYKVGGAWVQIVKGEVKPSSWNLQLEVNDLVRERERLRAAEIQATEIKGVPNVISFFDLKDPDGNKMRWFQVLTTDPKVTGKRD
jgi:predicted enzyme related to lactoylglutathione lyase